MRKENSYVLDTQDEKIVQLFIELGMPTNLAKTLLYVSQMPECLATNIEHGTDLCQPEVSVAMQELRRRGWAEKRHRKNGGKGRPVHIYKFTGNLPEIIGVFEQEKIQDFESAKKDLSELKNLIEKIGNPS